MTPEGIILASEAEQELAAGMLDAALDLVTEHEATEHEGAPCYLQRAGTVAYLAHHLGLDTGDLPMLGGALRAYDQQHEKGA